MFDNINPAPVAIVGGHDGWLTCSSISSYSGPGTLAFSQIVHIYFLERKSFVLE